MSQLPTPTSTPQRNLTLFDASCVIVGIIIGSGIFETSPFIASQVASPNQLIAVWLFGGVVALLGALCYVELATTYPQDGGDYVFLSRAFHPKFAFVFAWAEFWIIRPGNVGMMAFVFARYANTLFELNVFDKPHYNAILYACSAIVVLTAMNLIGVHAGKWTQNGLTVLKVLGLLSICAVGFFLSPAPPQPAPATATTSVDFRLAAILVLFTYGGWNELCYVAAEVSNPRKNIFRALVLGTITITAIYILTNLAFLQTLGLQGLQASQAVAADVFRPTLGTFAAKAMSIVVCLSCLGAINGMLFTGSRIYYKVGTEHRWFQWLGEWNHKHDTPTRALGIQLAMTVAIIVGFGCYQSGENNSSGFERLFNFTAPVFWFFILWVGVSLFVLRSSTGKHPQIFRIPFYPWTAILFCLLCGFLLHASTTYAIANESREAIWAIGILGVGILVGIFSPCQKQSKNPDIG